MLPLLKTKLFIPVPREDAVPRPRLAALLERGQTRPLTLVSAPAGFGKTTLVSSWVREYDVRAAWVSLDEGDNDPARFWLYFIGAIQTFDAQTGQEAYSLMQSPQPQPVEVCLTLLLNEIAAFAENFVLILDDYHVIENPEIHDGIQFLLDHLPSQIRLVIASRGDPPFALARLRARGQLTELRMADLSFTPDETADLLNDKMGLNICQEDIAALETRTEGWAAGLQLAALSIQGKEDIRGFIEGFTGSHAYLVDYLVEDVLQAQPEEVQTFLLQTSILERLTGALCEAVTGRAGSAAILEKLRQSNLFVIPLDAEKRWYRYHHLFAEVLRHRLQSYPMPDGVHELHARASQWYEQTGLNEEAIQHAFSALDLERASQLIETFAESWIRQGEHQTVFSWISQIPVPTIRTRPRLCIIYAQLLLWRHELEKASQYLDEAEQVISSTDAPLKGQILFVRASVAMRQSQYEHTIDLTRQAFGLVSPNDHALRGRLKLASGIALFWKDDHQQAARAFEEAALFARQAEDWYTALYAMANHALMYSLRGQLREAEKLFRRSLEFAATHHMEYSVAANISYGHLADLGHEWNDFSMMEHYLEKALKRTVIDQDPSRKLIVLYKLIKKHLALRNFEELDSTLQQAAQLAETYHLPYHATADIAYFQVRAWLMQGSLPAALAWAERKRLTPNDELTTIREPLYIALARILIAQGTPDQTVGLLKRLIELANTVGRIWIQFELRGLLVVALEASGAREEARQVLNETLWLAQPEGYIRSLVEAGDALQPLLRDMRANFRSDGDPNMIHYLDCLIQAFEPHLTPQQAPSLSQSPPSSASGLLEPLSDREREILQSIDAGLSNREIADKLYISVSTVKTHINNLYAKLDANSRTQALAIARKSGML